MDALPSGLIIPVKDLVVPPAGLDTATTMEEAVVKSQFWQCPLDSLDGWQPFSALLHHSLLHGPPVGSGQGIDLAKNYVGYWCGARGGLKSLSLSYNLAKILRSGKPVWTNYPISFYICEADEPPVFDETLELYQVGPCQFVNRDGSLWYYESMPLDMDKLYYFSKDIRKGAVGITELQYFVESRTSGRYENRMLSYQLMQIRKTANSFFYDVQNPRWVDSRFGWSADFEVECADISKLAYDRKSRELVEGEVGAWYIKDLSGVLTGQMFKKTEKIYGPLQFEGHYFWWIYPTRFIVDVFEALAGAKRDQKKKDAEEQLGAAIADVVNEFLDDNQLDVWDQDIWNAVEEHGIEATHWTIGHVLKQMGISKTRKAGDRSLYHLSVVMDASKDPEKAMHEIEEQDEQEQ